MDQNANLRGNVADNDNFLAPVFYVSSFLGDEVQGILAEMIGKDERFFVGASEEEDKNYNYNDNRLLVDAIHRGYSGAYWDILRRLRQEEKTQKLSLSV